jgi:hypothetical protein
MAAVGGYIVIAAKRRGERGSSDRSGLGYTLIFGGIGLFLLALIL